MNALIFDVDGTLADTESVHLEAFNHAFRQEGLDWHWSTE
ncbi:MAG: HAD hydrolase-like protein, partial [Gammaproteobacteria bacterium]|nr:HAD hydrolase-like protein [Gammaproteobacteria bacterium]